MIMLHDTVGYVEMIEDTRKQNRMRNGCSGKIRLSMIHSVPFRSVPSGASLRSCYRSNFEDVCHKPNFIRYRTDRCVALPKSNTRCMTHPVPHGTVVSKD